MRPLFLVPVLLAATIACPRPAPAADEDEAVVGPLPWEPGPDTFFLRRIVDASTGRPVAGARVDLHVEVPHPIPGPVRPVASGVSDAAGWVRIERSALDAQVVKTYGEPSWAYASAPGLGPDEDYHSMLLDRPDWELKPAAPLRFALKDPLDRPVVGAQVSWILGCGHTPDVRSATTDSQGVVVFDDVAQESGGRGWVVASGLACRYLDSRQGWTPWQRPRVEGLEWGRDVAGRILREDGTPAAGLAIGSLAGPHRGPWTFTAADGTFSLSGTSVDVLTLEEGEYAVGPKTEAAAVRTHGVPVSPEGVPLLFRIPKAGADEPPATARLRVHVDQPGWPSTDLPEMSATAVRLADGRPTKGTWTTLWTPPEYVADFELEGGEYEVIASAGEGQLVFSRARTRVTVSEAAPATVRVSLPPPAVVVLRAEKLTDVDLIVEGASRREIQVDADGRAVFVPTDRPIFVRVSSEDASTPLVRVPPEFVVAGKRSAPWTVPALTPVEVRARLVDAQGRPVAGRLTDDDADEPPTKGEATSEPRLSTTASVFRQFIAWPEDLGAWEPRFVRWPFTGAISTHLGTWTMAPRGPRLVVVLPEEPKGAVQVRLTRDRRSQVLDAESNDREAVLYDPWDAPGLLGEGTIVRVLDTDSPPIVRRLEGPGPWCVVVPTGSLQVEPVVMGGPLERGPFLTIDGVRLGDVLSGPPRLEAGAHEAVLDAPGRVARRLRFTLAQGETRVWHPVLRTR